ncbi:hypothetical protein I4U23_027113 [Adineta vaga]|nr:hypothetical protein I4U23_027113 [Adineta vaga]
MPVDIRRRFLELNLFKRNTIDEHELRIQRWSTRLYLILLIITMMILFFYTILQIETRQIILEHPSLMTYIDIYEKYGNIKCPCTDISIPYRIFLVLSPIYHQICSSDLVSEKWIEFLYDKQTTTFRSGEDFLGVSFSQFQILKSLCQISLNAINDDLEILYQSQLISDELLNQDLFNTQAEADISIFQKITGSKFLRSLRFMRSFIIGNALTTAYSTFSSMYALYDNSSTPSFYAIEIIDYVDGNYSCSCNYDFSCSKRAAFYNFNSSNIDNQLNVITYIDGWKAGCWPLESLLFSTLESFYNETIFNTIVYNINSSVSINYFRTLNISIRSNFNRNTTIQNLVDQFFIENWLKTLNYSSYFSQCQPQFCQYTINHRAELIYIITSLLGLYGGLSTVLHLIIPYIINILLKKFKRQSTVTSNEDTNTKKSFYQWFEHTGKTILYLNLYRSSLQITPIDIKRQTWSTRVYIGLLLYALFILSSYSSINMETRIIQIDNPPLDIVQKLENLGYSLTCPCQDLSVDYKYLFNLQPIFHQVCSSVFVTPLWTDYLNNIWYSTNSYRDFNEFVIIGSFLFSVLSSLCSLSNNTVNDALLQFGQTQLITNELLQIDLYTNQINSSIEQFKLTLPNSFLRLNQLSRSLLHINQFISCQTSNFHFATYQDTESSMYKFILRIRGYGSLASDGSRQCSCAFDTTCEDVYVVKYYNESMAKYQSYTVPYFPLKCFIMESLLSATLECLYDNNSCFDMIVSSTVTEYPLNKNWTRLNSSLFSNYPINVTIDKLLENLFIESWLTTISYSSYFNECQPIYCTYNIIQHRSLLEIITVITGLIGGLSKIFKLLSPYVISIIFNLINRYRQRHLPRNNNINQIYPGTCPCTKLSTTRSMFYEIEPRFHDVCSSDFVSYRWIHSTFDIYRNLSRLPINAFTFRGTSYRYFKSLSIMCNLIKQAANDARSLFHSTSIVSSQMLNPLAFDLNTNTTFKDFQSTLSNDFIRNLDMFRELTHGNGHISVYSTDWNIVVLNRTQLKKMYMTSNIYNQCDCALSLECIQYSRPYFPGYYVGCLSFEAFLRSTMECLYDQLCVEQMSKDLNLTYYLNALNQSNTRFNLTTSIYTIIKDIFIESWIINVSYEKFFQQCQPILCSFISQERYNLLYVITTLVGLYGGIVILLKLFVPFIINQLYKYKYIFHLHNRRVNPLN